MAGLFSFAVAHICAKLPAVDGNEFLRRVRRIAESEGWAVRLDERRGKGSHARLHVGDKFTTLKDRRKEIGEGLLTALCRQLGIDPKRLKRGE